MRNRPSAVDLGSERRLEQMFAMPRVSLERRPDGSMLLRNRQPLERYDRNLASRLFTRAAEHPDRLWLAERSGANRPWRQLTYGHALDLVTAIATWLLQQSVSQERPVLILSENSIDAALLSYACYLIGLPVASISPSYSLMPDSLDKLRALVALVAPGLIYASDYATYERALRWLKGIVDAPIVSSSLGVDDDPRRIRFATITRAGAPDLVRQAADEVQPSAIARLLFTSGSTGMPKAVINTHLNVCSNMAARSLAWPLLEREPLVLADWLPWSHVFGANNLALSLYNGWTLFIDGGKPTESGFAATVANITEVKPSFHNNVPLGYEMLIGEMRRNAAFRRAFFCNMRLLFYAGSALPRSTWEGLQDLATLEHGQPIPIVTQWGATETGPTATDSHFIDPRHFRPERSGNVGIPVAGMEIKLLRHDERLEARVRGPGVMPGYWRNSAATAKAFDEEGFYIIGDALRFADEERPEEGLFFDGRVSEDFKLLSGTWVHGSQMRLHGITALTPLVHDLIVTGHNYHHIGFLIVPNLKECRALTGASEETPVRIVLSHPKIRQHIQQGLRTLRGDHRAASRFAARARFLIEPLSIAAGEITDKGYINQRAVLAVRTADVAAIQSDDPEQWIGIAD